MDASQRRAKYLLAVETIARNCGRSARTILAADAKRFSDSKFRSLAGTSPQYQRHVLERAEAGDSNPLRMNAATLLVYDTVAFREVTSRLYRATGIVRREAEVLAQALDQGIKPDRLSDRLLTLDLIAEQSLRLRERLEALETVAVPPSKRVSSVKAKKPMPSEQYSGSLNAVGNVAEPGLVEESCDTVESTDSSKLHAASALGLIAKNVRNVAVLQSEHRPTREQKAVALRLTADTYKRAIMARNSTARAFGRADNACRVKATRTPTRRVITHSQPDGDAVAAAWLAERFLFANEPVEVLFLPRGRVFGAYRIGDCLVDVGNTHDPAHWFFDHKPPAFPNRHDACAARLVWDRLIKLGHPVRHLKPLVDVVFAGDSARERGWHADEYAESKKEGFHRRVADAARLDGTDAGVYRALRRWLDALHRRTVTRS